MLFSASFPKKAGFYTVLDIENLEKALGFPRHCLVRNIPPECFQDGFISLASFYELVDGHRFSHELDYVFDFHSALTNNATLAKAISALNYHQMTYEEIHLARTAFNTYEDADMKGLPIDEDVLLNTLRTSQWLISRLQLKRILHHTKGSLLTEGRLQLDEFFQLLMRCRRYSEVLTEYLEFMEIGKVPRPSCASAVRGMPVRSHVLDKLIIGGVSSEVIQALPRSQLHLSEPEHESLCRPTDEQLLEYLDEQYVREAFAYRQAPTTCVSSSIPPIEPLVYSEFRKRISRSGRQQSQAIASAVHEAKQCAKSAVKLADISLRMRQHRKIHSALPDFAHATRAQTFALPVAKATLQRSKTDVQLARASSSRATFQNSIHSPTYLSGRCSTSETLVTDVERNFTQQALEAIRIDAILLAERYDERLLDDMDELRPGFKQRVLDKRKAEQEKRRAIAMKQLLHVDAHEDEAKVEFRLDLERLVKPLTRRTTGKHAVNCNVTHQHYNGKERKISSAT